MKFPERLKLLRKENNWSREYLGKKMGVSYSSIAKYESGVRKPDPDSLLELASIFECTTDYLLGNSDNRNLTKEDEEFREKHNLDEGVKEVMFRDMKEQLKDYSEEEVEEILEWMKFKAEQNRKKREKQQGD